MTPTHSGERQPIRDGRAVGASKGNLRKGEHLSTEEQQLFREWLDAWIRLTEIEAKMKQTRGGE
jgi:hypothetical protein